MKLNIFKILATNFIDQIKQIQAIITISCYNFINRLGISLILIIIILLLSKINIINSDFSNLRWALIGAFSSTLATITLLDAYTKYLKYDAFSVVLGQNIVEIDFKIELIIQQLLPAFWEDYNQNIKQVSDIMINEEVVLQLKEELNNSKNINFIDANKFEIMPRLYKSINRELSEIIYTIIPNILIYADKKDFIENIVILSINIKRFLNIIRIHTEGINIWYPANMRMAPKNLCSTVDIINSLNIFLDNVVEYYKKINTK